MKIMIIDDEKSERLAIRSLSEKLCFDVVAELDNGYNAMDYYRRCQPDIVTIDLEMPNMNGIKVLRDLKHYDSKIKVIIVTSTIDQVELDNVMSEGAYLYLNKPLALDDFSFAIRAVSELELPMD